MHLVFLVLLLFGIVGFFMLRGWLREQRHRRNRSDELQPVAEQLELELVELELEAMQAASEELLGGSRLRRLGDDGAGFDRMLRGSRQGLQVFLFDYQPPAPAARPDEAFTVLVIRLRGTAFPRFVLEPVGPRSDGAQGALDPTATYRPLQPSGRPLFNETFRLAVRPQDCELLQRRLEGAVINFFEARLSGALWVESLGDRLLIYDEDRVVRADRLEPLLREALSLCEALRGEPGDEAGQPAA